MEFKRLKDCDKITSQIIESFENRLGIYLPNEYQKFLLKYNGAKPKFECFKIGNDNESLIQNFLGLNCRKDYNNIEKTIKTYSNRIPDSLLPIAGDQLGNIICLGIDNNNNGKIYFLDHEQENNEKYITQIAESFTQFLDSLYDCNSQEKDEIFKLVKANDISTIENLLDKGFPLEKTNEYNRSLLEEATISAKDDILKLLIKRGALARNSLELAKQNAEFFPEHKKILALLKKYYNK